MVSRKLLLLISLTIIALISYTYYYHPKSEHGGIGVLLDVHNGSVTVYAPIKNYPADRAGLLPGDRIDAVNGVATAGKGLAAIAGMLRGRASTAVNLTIMREGFREALEFRVVREEVRITESNRKMSGGVGMVLNFTGGYPVVEMLYYNRGAYNAGIREGDVITEVDGISVKDARKSKVVDRIMGSYAGSEIMGTTVNLTVERGGKTLMMTVVRDIDPLRPDGIGVKWDIRKFSIRVGRVLEGGPADDAGLREGDPLLSIDGHPVRNILKRMRGDENKVGLELRNMIQMNPSGNITVTVLTDDGSIRTYYITRREIAVMDE
jgi:C-terminal processing protease CtpA/Prc